MKPKVNSGHLAPDLLAQSGSGRQVFGCGQSGEDNGLVGEIAVFTLSFDSLKVIYIPAAPQTNSNGRLICTAKSQPSASASILLFGYNGRGGRAARNDKDRA
jgi:hypothetical protein